ncbi:hypothetical protein EUTSA_v10003084mg, partial [Eutrema salsugineum]
IDFELHYSKQDPKEVLYGLSVPQLKGNGATGLAISLLGAMVMPHNLFLHSDLVPSKKISRSVTGIKEACQYYLIESGLALTVAFLINVSVISVSGAMILSFELPFALVPLLNFTSSKTKMGSHANSLLTSSVTWLIGGLIKGINIYYLVSSFIKLLLHGHMKLVAIVLLGEDTKFASQSEELVFVGISVFV